jgi:hypothetical protein
MKTCKKCLSSKDESEFTFDKNKKDELSIYCKDCQKLIREKYKGKYKDKRKQYYQENKEKIKQYYNDNIDKIKEYYQENVEKKKEYRKEYWEENKETLKDKYKGKYKYPFKPRNLTEEQKLKKKSYGKEYKQIHKDRYRINHRIYKKLKKETDPVFRLKERCRGIISNSIRRNGYTKKSRTHQILGCSYEDFKTHIESQFQDWMNWDNYGLYNGQLNYGWDIDHIVPCASAITEEELLKLNHYTNLKPLCSKVNRDIKRDRLDF